ncbi:hypothetical protein F2Q69_00022571 [Brassica cretica]|uniref:Uncharacterized protein n=1 Tax=Brassica cretica TaxID=69181 RepID=A0A8S9QEQ4_BRACR|nr:hypothetical protein F2Q69_00022571 [Brassica cretica]
MAPSQRCHRDRLTVSLWNIPQEGTRDEKGSVKRRCGLGRPPTSEDGNASNPPSVRRRRDQQRKIGPCKIKGKSSLKREVSQKDTYLQKKKLEYPSEHPDLPLRIKHSGLLFINRQSSRLHRLQDATRSPELLHF